MSAPDDFAARLRAGAHLDELTSALDTDQVVTRSRRRRTTGRVATGTVSLALTAGAVLLAPSLLPTRSVPPASTGAPTTSSTQAPSPAATSPGAESPGPTGALPAGFVDGHVPAWLEGSGLACGADAVAPQPAGTVVALRAAGTATSEQTPDGTWLYTFDATLTSAATSTVDLWAPDLAAVAWVQDGRIVGLGPNNAESASIAALPPDQPRAVHASATRTDYCVPNSDGTYTTDLPAGDYELVLYLRVSPDTYDPATTTWITSQRLTATLTEDGRLTDVEAEG
ncbi:hypothetical protein AFE02nite_32100 [Actinotalea fermentans]|uniref:Uncharacterized protein n=1 Tax=Actinotalea fermentans TaxID=43671 RepID=A0A511Z254_9CELL|nr:hypothetical protein AFE02nite_32100 [Actinotalea fermentans]